MTARPTDADPRTEAAAQHLRQLQVKLGALRAALRRGDRLPRPTGAPTPAAIERRAAQARAERWDARALSARGLAPLGGAPAPLDVALLDTIRDIELALVELAEAAADRVAPDLAPPAPEKAVRRLLDLLGAAATDADLLDHVAAEARRLDQSAGAALGDTEPLVRLSIRCPVCGALSLRLLEDREQVLCVNAGCQCSDWLCGCDEGRRHVWGRAEWGLLGLTDHTEGNAA